MTKTEKEIWKGWEQTDQGFERTFGKIKVISIGGFFYVKGIRHWTLKEALGK